MKFIGKFSYEKEFDAFDSFDAQGKIQEIVEEDEKLLGLKEYHLDWTVDLMGMGNERD